MQKPHPKWRIKISKHFVLLLSFLIALVNIHSSLAQMSGTYSVGNGLDFHSIQEAVDSLELKGVIGPVIISINSGTYNEQIEIGTISGTSNTNNIVFQSASSDSSSVIISYESMSSDSNWVIQFKNNARYFTFNHISIVATGETYACAIWIEGTPRNLNFTNCVFKGNYRSSTRDYNKILIHCDENAIVDSLVFNHNLFSQSNQGLYIRTKTTYPANPNEGLIISNNTFKDLGYSAIEVQNAAHPKINYNQIEADQIGLTNRGCYISYEIIGNTVNTGYEGINAYSESGNFTSPGLIYNNFIHVGNTLHAEEGIRITGNNPVNIYHNSIYMVEDYYANYGIYVSQSVRNVNIVNNIIAHKYDGTPIYMFDTSSVDTFDYNCFYHPGNVFAYTYATGKIFSLSEFKSIFNNNHHSVEAYPFFIADTNLHAQSAWLDGNAFPIPGISTDIDGEIRNSNYPDIGADEFTHSPDIGMPLSGDYLVGPGQHFNSLQQAFNSLWIKGISGSVNLSLIDGEHTGNSRLYPVAGSNKSNIITITSASNDFSLVTISHSAVSDDDNYVIDFYGCDHVNLHNLSLQASGSLARVLRFSYGADSIQITQNQLESSTASGNDGNKQIVYSDDSYFNYRLFKRNTFNNGSRGIHSGRYAAKREHPSGLNVVSNHFNNIEYMGVYAQFHKSPFISENTIEGAYSGIFISSCDSAIRVLNNKISIKYDYGVYVSASSGSGSNKTIIANNMITGLGNHDLKGIYISSTGEALIAYNSVLISGTHANSRSIHTGSGNGLSLLNNIFASTGNGYAAQYATTTAIDSLDFNNYFTDGYDIALWGATPCTDLTALQTESSKDKNSIETDPGFICDTVLYLGFDNTLSGKATPIDDVIIDIDGEPRDALMPTIGADEYGEPVNHTPLIVHTIPDILIPEDTGAVDIARLDTVFSDIDLSDELSYSVSNSHPAFTCDIANNTLTVTAMANSNGRDTVLVKACDLAGACITDTVFLWVYNINDAPVAENIYDTVHNDTFLMLDVLSHAYDIDGDELRTQSLFGAAHGDAVIHFGTSAVRYEPEDDFEGTDTIWAIITDSKGGYDTSRIEVYVYTVTTVCGAGTEYVNGECQTIVTCGEGTTNVDNTCVPSRGATCGKGTKEVDGICVPASTACQDGTHLDPETGLCVPDFHVVCGAGTRISDDGTVCVPGNLLACGAGTYLDEETGTCLLISEIDEKYNKPFVRVYPNPAQELVNIECKNALIENVVFTNLTGQIVLYKSIKGSGSCTINTGALHAGLYFVVINTGNDLLQTRLVIK